MKKIIKMVFMVLLIATPIYSQEAFTLKEIKGNEIDITPIPINIKVVVNKTSENLNLYFCYYSEAQGTKIVILFETQQRLKANYSLDMIAYNDSESAKDNKIGVEFVFNNKIKNGRLTIFSNRDNIIFRIQPEDGSSDIVFYINSKNFPDIQQYFDEESLSTSYNLRATGSTLKSGVNAVGNFISDFLN